MGVPTAGVIGVDGAADPMQVRMPHVRYWLGAHVDVAPSMVWPLVFRWHGPFDDLETLDPQLPDG